MQGKAVIELNKMRINFAQGSGQGSCCGFEITAKDGLKKYSEFRLEQQSNRRRTWLRTGLIGLFLIGLTVAVYPSFSQWYYRVEVRKTNEAFRTARESAREMELQERLAQARAYNQRLVPGTLSDPYGTSADPRSDGGQMAKEQIAVLEIPVIDQELPVFAGTSAQILSRGRGHLEGTSLPVGGPGTHSVITAHNGFPTARLFTDLEELTIGDRFWITSIGGRLTYEVDQILTVEPHDFDPVSVDPDGDYVTLLTCTPRNINSHRLLVRGSRVIEAPVTETLPEDGLRGRDAWFLSVRRIASGLLAGGVPALWLSRSRRKRKKGSWVPLADPSLREDCP